MSNIWLVISLYRQAMLIRFSVSRWFFILLAKKVVGGIAVEVDLLVDVGFVVLFPDDIQLLMFHFVLLSDFRHKKSRKSIYGFPAWCCYCEDRDYLDVIYSIKFNSV